MSSLSKELAEMPSASHYVTTDEMRRFKVGAHKREVLEALNWRGHLYLAARLNGQSVAAILYRVVEDDQRDDPDEGTLIWAVFVEDEFSKLVAPPASEPDDMDVTMHNGTPWHRPKRLNAGDPRFLERAFKAPAIEPGDLVQRKRAAPTTVDRIDPGLTAAYVLLKAMGADVGVEARITESDYRRNAALRDQFNASRLSLGMTRGQVEATLKSPAIESGAASAGMYCLYGSDECFQFGEMKHFSNVLVIYKDNSAVTVATLPAGEGWRTRLNEVTSDLLPSD